MGEPLVVYLDQFAWIDLARRIGREPAAADDETLASLRAMAETRAVIFPISVVHVLETNRRLDLRSRRDIVSAMVLFSHGWFLAPYTDLMVQEMHVALAGVFGASPGDAVCPLGRGLPFAFGRHGKLQEDLHVDELEALLLEARIDSPDAMFHLLGGASSAFIEPTRTELLKRAQNGAEEEERKRAVYRRFTAEERKRAHAANLTLSLQDDLRRALADLGRTEDDFFNLGQERLMDFWESVPTADVELELVTARDKQWSRRIDANDLNDIGFLAAAIPYCDAIVTERFWEQLCQQAGLLEKYDTAMVASLDSLVDLLRTLDY